MPFITDQQREQWRVDNTDLIDYMRARAGTSRFIGSLHRSYLTYGSLTPNQTTALRRLITDDSRETVDADSLAAQGEEAADIPNGTFTITIAGQYSHHTFKIHTVRNGTLAGKRIVKRLLNTGEYKGFAFITRASSLKVWRSFYEDEAAGTEYIGAARTLITMLRAQADDHISRAAADGTDEFEIDETTARIQASVLCRICNRALTNPESIERGIGPDCWGRLHPSDPAPLTMPNIINSANITTASDEAMSVTDHTQPDSIAALERAMRTQNYYGMYPCPYCARDDFRAASGRTRHVNSCATQNNNITRVESLRRLRTNINAPRTVNNIPRSRYAAQPRVSAVRVNLSQLGTRIGGAVWDQ